MRVTIVEDSVLLREGIARLFAEFGHEVVHTAASADGAADDAIAHTPDLVVMDVRLPPTFTDEGVRAALAIRAVRPQQPIVVPSHYVEERYAIELLQSDASALGYLLKDRVGEVRQFIEGCERVAAGGTVLDPEVVAQLFATRARSRLEGLTPREREVLALMAEGHSNLGIAQRFVISENAVEKHISSVFRKLDLAPSDLEHRRVLAVLEFLRAGR